MDRANRFYRLPPQVLATSACVGWFALVWFAGCSSWISKKGERDNHFQKETKRIQDLMADPDRPRLIGEVANSLGMSPSQYDSYALVSSLPGTGGIVRPGIQRDWILDEMRKRETESPETFLDDVSTALVKLKIIAKPCDAKGDIFDIEIDNCTECLATDLTEGYVLESRLSELAMLKGRLHTSEPKAIGSRYSSNQLHPKSRDHSSKRGRYWRCKTEARSAHRSQDRTRISPCDRYESD